MVNMSQSLDNGNNNRVVFDLQHFSEVGGAEASAVPASDAPSPTSFEEAGSMYMKTLESNTDATGAATAETTATPHTTTDTPTPGTQPPADASQQSRDIIELFKAKGVTKFTDPAKVVESVLAQEKWNTRLSQENAELKRKMAEYKPPTPAAAPAQSPATPPEKLDPDAFIAKLYEDPTEALAPLKEQWRQEFLQELAPTLQSVRQMAEAGKAAATQNAQKEAAQLFFSENADAVGFIEQMTDILAQDPSFGELDDPVAISDMLGKTLTYVKGMSYQAPQKPEDLVARLLADENMFNQYIASNPEIKNKLLSSAVSAMQRTPAPPMVSAPGGATMTPRPAAPPTSFEALGDSLKKSFGYT